MTTIIVSTLSLAGVFLIFWARAKWDEFEKEIGGVE